MTESSLTETWQEFVDAWIAFLQITNSENEERLYEAIKNYPVGEKESEQEEWVLETKVLINQVRLNDRNAWKKIYLFILERYKEHDYHQQILLIAQSKNIGEPVWTL